MKKILLLLVLGLTSCSSIMQVGCPPTYVYLYQYTDNKEYNAGADIHYYNVGDTVVLFPSKREIVVVKRNSYH